MKRKQSSPVTEQDWETVFQLRCRCRRGDILPPVDQALCEAAYASDPARYASRSREVFLETAPFGSQVR